MLYILGLKLLLLQESQLLLPLLTDPRDKWVEKSELFTLFIHLEVGVLKHNFKPVICEDIREALRETWDQIKSVPSEISSEDGFTTLLYDKPMSHIRHRLAL